MYMLQAAKIKNIDFSGNSVFCYLWENYLRYRFRSYFFELSVSNNIGMVGFYLKIYFIFSLDFGAKIR